MIFFLILKEKTRLYSDYLFTHNKAVSKLYKKYIKSNILATSAVRSNSVKINKKIYDIGYVSTYRDYDPNMKLHKNYYYRDSKAGLKLIKHLKDALKKKIFIRCHWFSQQVESQKKKYYDKFLAIIMYFLKTTIKEELILC